MALATLGIIICAIGWILGLMDIRRAATVVVGIVVIGSAASLAQLFIGGGG